jgi:hypothetical protein
MPILIRKRLARPPRPRRLEAFEPAPPRLVKAAVGVAARAAVDAISTSYARWYARQRPAVEADGWRPAEADEE